MKRIAWALCASLLAACSPPPASRDEASAVPQFQVDPFWPKPLPNNWIMGQIGGLAVDAKDHAWVLQRPRSLTNEEKGASLTPPRSKCCHPAPSVMEFDADGNFVQGWGFPGTRPWVTFEHGIHVDREGFVWITGAGPQDNAIYKFTPDGKLVLTIGSVGPTRGSNDTTRLGQPASVEVDDQAHEIFVADGYGNRRVIVFDSETGAYKRHWGAYGNRPVDAKLPAYDPSAPPRSQFGNPVHCATLSRDGRVYVCDRTGNRIQVFRKDGTYETEWFYDKPTLGRGASWGLAMWPDAGQSHMIHIDGENNLARVLRRSDGQHLGGFGRSGRNAGDLHLVHAVAIDSRGNVYTGESDDGKRVQKFRPTNGPPK